MQSRLVMLVIGASLATAALAGSASAQSTSKSSNTNSCPSEQTVMTSDWYGATSTPNGTYLCAQEYHRGDVKVGAGKTDTFTTATDVTYFPQYYCWDSSDDKEFTYAHAEIFGSGSVSAFNWGTGSHVWGAGYLYTLGSGSVTGWTNGCYDNSDVWKNKPNLLQITNITANGLPDNGTTKAGVPYSISVTVKPGSYASGASVVLQDSGVNVASSKFDQYGSASFTWTPAQMGSQRLIQVAWPGTSSILGNITDKYYVTVAGGMAATIQATGAKTSPPSFNADTGNASVTVAVESTPDPLPPSAQVVLVDTSTGTKVANPVPVTPNSGSTTSGTAAISFPFTNGKQYKFIAKVLDSSGTKTLGQSYVGVVQAPPTITATVPTAKVYASTSAGCQWIKVPVNVTPTTATGTVSITDGSTTGPAVSLSGGAASPQYCPPSTAGTAKFQVSYNGDATFPAGKSATNSITLSSGIPSTLTITSVTNNNSNASSATVKVSTSGVPSGSTITINGAKSPVNTTVSNNAATATVTTQNSTKYGLTAQYTPSIQSFVSPKYNYTSPSTQPSSGAVNTGPVDMQRSARQSAMERGGQAATARRPGAKAAPSGTRGVSRPGQLEPVDTGVRTVNRSAKITSSRRGITLTCPSGYYPLNASGGSSGPDTDFRVSFSGRSAKIVSPQANVGYRMSATALCRADDGVAMAAGALGFGTRGPDEFNANGPGRTVFAGPGPDRVTVSGSNSLAWGGMGADRILVGGRNSAGAGGPGRDRIVAMGRGRTLLWGGPGRDVLVGGLGSTLINAQDGQGGDRVLCRSSSNRVMLDAGDRTKGPCTVVTPG